MTTVYDVQLLKSALEASCKPQVGRTQSDTNNFNWSPSNDIARRLLRFENPPVNRIIATIRVNPWIDTNLLTCVQWKSYHPKIPLQLIATHLGNLQKAISSFDHRRATLNFRPWLNWINVVASELDTPIGRILVNLGVDALTQLFLLINTQILSLSQSLFL